MLSLDAIELTLLLFVEVEKVMMKKKREEKKKSRARRIDRTKGVKRTKAKRGQDSSGGLPPSNLCAVRVSL